VLASHSSGGSAYKSKINKLDDDIVKEIPVPVLFGIALMQISPNFGDPRDGGARLHEGLDLMAQEGTPIVSPTEAVVIRTGTDSGAGKYVRTANPGGESFVYMHLSDIGVKSGQVLKEGDLIGYVGSTGNASKDAPHLHFEIRDGRKALDPFLRIKKEFTLEQKMDSLEQLLDEEGNNADDVVEFLIEKYLGVFYQARVMGIQLPEDIVDAMPLSVTGVSRTTSRDLEVGSEGTDVMELQSILIAEGYLKTGVPTDYFGPLTKAALAVYQKTHGIEPASGFYGATTRAYLKGGGTKIETTTSVPVLSEKEMLARIAELTILLKKLQAQQ